MLSGVSMATLKSKQAKPKIEKLFKYFYCIKEETQPSLLEGSPSTIIKTSVGDVHVVHRGRLMCKESMEATKNRLKASGTVIAETLPKNVPMCETCKEEYKRHPDSPWYKWIEQELK